MFGISKRSVIYNSRNLDISLDDKLELGIEFIYNSRNLDISLDNMIYLFPSLSTIVEI